MDPRICFSDKCPGATQAVAGPGTTLWTPLLDNTYIFKTSKWKNKHATWKRGSDNMRNSSKSKKRFVSGKVESGVREEGQEAANVC